jgi:uncharacterized membrane protein YfcA
MGPLPSAWWVFIVLGLGAGVISGMLGVGSGVLLIPVLVLLSHFEQKAAQGTALAVMVPMALVGAIRYWRNPAVELNGVVIGLLVLGAVAGALVGTELAARLPAGVLRKVFAVFLMLVAVRMFTLGPRPGEIRREVNSGGQGRTETVSHGDKNESTGQK